MITPEELKEIVASYGLESSGIVRKKYLQMILPALDRKEILILKGVRRCGKTTLLKQMHKHLLEKGVSHKSILYVNLDDHKFFPYRSLDLLELIISTFDTSKRCYLFLDEVQTIPLFETWLRSMYDREVNVKFIISGSHATLLSKDLATLLTGRNLTYEIFPLDYAEFLIFDKKGSIEDFLRYGGFPEVVLEKNIGLKKQILQNYVSDIINKDILLRRSIKDASRLTYFAQYLLQNPGVRISINKLAKATGLNFQTAEKYLEYLMDAYLIFEVPFFSYSAKDRFSASKVSKYYPLDNGFYFVHTARLEMSRLYEASVGQALFFTGKGVGYWKESNEVDFITENKAINVVSSLDFPEREFEGLEQIRSRFKYIKKAILVAPTTTEKSISLQDFFLKMQKK